VPDQTPAAFISYCRDDQEFALRLAQDLKEAGAAVWIDQLDIAPGATWDTAIEEALIASPRMLLVLSPSSSHSPNVRNEISFALDQGKIVIPVLYHDCIVPLQLQRNNRVDFRADYAKGLALLLSHLQVHHPDQSVLDRAAEGDAHRQAAWQAREAEAERLRRLEDQTPPPEPARPVISPPPQPIVTNNPAVPTPQPWLRGKNLWIVMGGIAAILILGFALIPKSPPATVETASPQSTAPPTQPTATPPDTTVPSAPAPTVSANGSIDTASHASQVACVFDPISNVRSEPNANSAIACSIDTVREINIATTPIHVNNATWWPTDACGTPAYIANNQIHTGRCPAQ